MTNMTIFDMLGRSVYAGAMKEKTQTIEIRDFKIGIYFAVVKTGSSQIVRKFVRT